ncbi:MAG TPA: DUF2520 domain-containing protein, partial [Gemmatimonadales bacterium]|nr:DUF2520 domain-containing protein [Gemmatimonadales bacterium]
RTLATGLVATAPPWADALRAAQLIVITTPDDEIPTVARSLAHEGAVGKEQVVMHLAGPLDRGALAALAATGAALGSYHPLQTVADPASAPERFAGAYAAVEGDDRAIAAGEELARALGMTPFRLKSEAKPAYHAGAVFAANYAVVLAGVAERIARGAGIPPELAGKIYLPLLAGAVANVERLGPVRGLTGPVRRGDVRAIMAHLGALEDGDQQLYRTLGLEAVRLAREAGLDPVTARQVEALLSDEP